MTKSLLSAHVSLTWIALIACLALSGCAPTEEPKQFSWGADYYDAKLELVKPERSLIALSDSIVANYGILAESTPHLMNIEADKSGEYLFFEYRLRPYSDAYCIVAYSLSSKRVVAHTFPNRA